MSSLFSKKNLSLIDFGIEELILFSIIILNFLDAFEILPPDLDYVKKIISWAGLGYLFYQARPSEILTGSKSTRIDLYLTIGYFFMIIKNLVSYAYSAIDESSVFLKPFYTMLISYAALIETFGMYIGISLLLAAALYFAFKIPIKKPSVLFFLHEKNLHGILPKQVLHRLVTFLFVSIMFFVMVFNLMMEWLAIAIDAPLAMMGIAFYIFFVIKNKSKFKSGSFISKFGDFGSNFYKGVIDHLKYKKTLFLAVGGMLILHMLTDVFNFMWPYVFGIADPLYFSLFGEGHSSLFELFVVNVAGLNIVESLFVFIMYFGNVFAMIFLLTFSGFLWRRMYQNKHVLIDSRMGAGIYISLIILLFYPIFTLGKLGKNGIYGVDIQTHLINWGGHLLLISLFIISAYFIINYLYKIKKIGRVLTQILIVISQIFMVIYISIYFFAIGEYYIKVIGILINSNLLLAIMFILMFISNIIFYFIGIYGFELRIYRLLLSMEKSEI